MTEGMRHDEHPEKGTETFPSPDEVKSLLARILHRKDFAILSDDSDPKGASLILIETVIDGTKVKLQFGRAKNDITSSLLPDGGRFSASIHLTEYNNNGKAMGGRCVANYLDGNWSDIREVSS